MDRLCPQPISSIALLSDHFYNNGDIFLGQHPYCDRTVQMRANSKIKLLSLCHFLSQMKSGHFQ